jgi:hypothetical protein
VPEVAATSQLVSTFPSVQLTRRRRNQPMRRI